MKVKQGKKVRKSMAMYTHVFGFRAPYRVLCDGNFLQASLDMKLYVKDMLPKTLLGPCVPLVSTCIRSELQLIGDPVSGASLIAKRFECIRCSCGNGGSRTPSARSCIQLLVGGALADEQKDQKGKKPNKTGADSNSGDEIATKKRKEEERKKDNDTGHNSGHFVVATQDVQLINALRRIPGVPVIQVTGNAGSGRYTLHPPSPATTTAASRREIAKCAPNDDEKRTIDRKISAPMIAAPDGEPASKAAQILSAQIFEKPRRKKIKGPNPLSVKRNIHKETPKSRKRQHHKRQHHKRGSVSPGTG